MLDCWDCYVARELARLHACPRHATPKQRAIAERRVLDVANQPHPLLRTKR